MTDTTTSAQPEAPTLPDAPTSSPRRQQLARLRNLALIPPIIGLMIYGYVNNPDVFLTKGYFVDSILKNMAPLALIVLAEALVLIVGKFDLSLESIVGIAPAVAVFFVVGKTSALGAPWPAWTVLPVAVVFGALVGVFNGLLIVRFKLSAFIVTLAMLITLRGLQLTIVGGATMSNLNRQIPVLDYLGSVRILTLPLAIWIVAIAFGIGILVLGYTRIGRSLYAVGGNPNAARAAGIRVERVIWLTFVVAGVLAALAGLMLSAQLGSVAANQGEGLIFEVFAAAVIGGISLDGGKGSLFGALTGVLLLSLIKSVLTLARVPGEQIQMVYGLVILGALVLARLTTGKAQD
jgi:simple sugar transport system permease protein